MAKHPATARLLAVDPDFGRFLTDEERAGARQLAVPTEVIPKGPVDTGALLADENGFGALVLEGMLMHRLRISDQLAMRLIGPGDFLFLSGAPRSILVEDATCSATAPTRVAILGDETLAAVRRWPGLSSGLFVRLAEQSDRLAVQLAICQLPRVDQRVLSLLWLLAEMWGHVGPAGTALPVAFTHDALGALVGARRPTVTLALGELSDRGAIVRQDGGWLLLEPPPAIAGEPRLTNDEPSLLPRRGAEWRHGSDNQSADLSHEELLRTVETLHQEHTRTRDQIAAQLASVRRSRQRCEEIRTRVAADRATRRVPSSGSARNGRSR